MPLTKAFSDAMTNDEVNAIRNVFRLVLVLPIVLSRILFVEFAIIVLIIVGYHRGSAPCRESDFCGLRGTLRRHLPPLPHSLRLLRAVFVTVLTFG